MKKIFAVGTIIMLMLTGCNYQMVDLNYNFDYAIININGEYQKIEIEGGETMKMGNRYRLLQKMELSI